MDGGLVIDEKDFGKLKSRDRDTLIYKNLLHNTNRIDVVENKLNKLDIVKLGAAIWLFLLTVAAGFKDFIPFIK